MEGGRDYMNFDEHDWDCLHDVIIDATGQHCNQSKLEELFKSLPKEIRRIAIQWGMNDTVFRDEVFKYIQELNK